LSAEATQMMIAYSQYAFMFLLLFRILAISINTVSMWQSCFLLFEIMIINQ
jgi:hypothetical protein